MMPSKFVVVSAASVIVVIVAFGAMPSLVEGAYTYQKLDDLMPELRQYLGRTHLGTLKARQFYDDAGNNAFQQIRERKSNNLRNLMRIGKRSAQQMSASVDTAGGGGGGAKYSVGGASAFSPVYYIPNEFIQAFRPQSVWLRR